MKKVNLARYVKVHGHFCIQLQNFVIRSRK